MARDPEPPRYSLTRFFAWNAHREHDDCGLPERSWNDAKIPYGRHVCALLITGRSDCPLWKTRGGGMPHRDPAAKVILRVITAEHFHKRAQDGITDQVDAEDLPVELLAPKQPGQPRV